MCGIAGFVNFNGHSPDDARARLKQMTDTLRHRGPDADGFYVDGNAALGHRRLSIIDLSTGQQPMQTPDGQIQIVFNGEIYNFIELREELERKGYRFATSSDTEVILHAYVEWGEQCVERFNGMFAFALWDLRVQRLFLARDRVGKKPLYYYRDGATLAFASELKSLRAGDFCPSEIDVESLDCYLSMGYIPAPRTIYRGVAKMPPASTLLATADGNRERRYWRLSYADKSTATFDETVDQFEELLDDAVRRRLVSDVPLGAFLSGGLDSSLVVASMARVLDRPVRTHSIGFSESEFSELAAARSIAAHLRTDHQEFVVAPRATDVLERISWHFDEPMADSSAVPTWYVCEMTRRSVTVALSGDGGDEAFGGYTFRYVPHVHESRLRALLPVWLRCGVFGPIGALWPGSARLPKPLRLKSIFENLAVDDAQAFYRDLIWLRDDVRRRLYRPEFLSALKGFTPFETVQPHYVHNDAGDALGRSQYTDINVYMTDDVLVKVDRMSMAHSLEVRSPLLDYRILEFAARLPSDAKLSGGRGKLPLRAAAARRLPADIHKLPKRGFSIPAARWLREDLRTLAEELIFERGGLIASYLDASAVQRLWREHLAGARDHSVLIWALMMLSLWSKTSRAHA